MKRISETGKHSYVNLVTSVEYNGTTSPELSVLTLPLFDIKIIRNS
jgi:hypothetical protein